MEQGSSTTDGGARAKSRHVASERSHGSVASKSRSCVTCRSRRVRCDKRSPCSNCRRAGIACIVPSAEGPPRWARNLEKRPGGVQEPATSSVAKVKERLKNLESLVKQFSRELDEASAAADVPSEPLTTVRIGNPIPSSGSTAAENTDLVPSQNGRFCGPSTHYVTSSFWNRIDEELAGLRAVTRDVADLASTSSEDEELIPEAAAQPMQRMPLVQNAFPFSIDPTASLDTFRPLPSQIPYLLEVYENNVNFFVRVIHMPTLLQTTRSPKAMSGLPPTDDALLFAVYYAAIASMEDADVLTNFGFSRAVLTEKYRTGLETCLVRADFLNNPNITIVKALVLFLGLHRRHESPRFVWMMFGLLTRMAQYLGLHRDGSHSPHLSVFEVEMRRRVWWTMCLIDQKTAEDQGTHINYASLDFDTRAPLNINDSDIDPKTTSVPPERYGVTDMSFARISVALTEIHR